MCVTHSKVMSAGEWVGGWRILCCLVRKGVIIICHLNTDLKEMSESCDDECSRREEENMIISLDFSLQSC